MGSIKTYASRLLDWTGLGEFAFRSASIEVEAHAALLRGQQVASVISYTRPFIIGNVCCAIALAAIAWGSPVQWLAICWSIVIVALAAHTWVRRQTTRARNGGKTASEKTLKRAILNAALLGTIWASGLVMLSFNVNDMARLVLICVQAAVLGGSAVALGGIPLAALSFIAPVTLASIFSASVPGGREGWILGALVVCYAYLILLAIAVHSAQLRAKLFETLEMERAANEDALTGLTTRASFVRALDDAFLNLHRYGDVFALLYIDLDHFKGINDSLGHAAGDELLMQAAVRLRSVIRDKDIASRYGGDEFLIMANGISNPEQALRIGEKLIKAFTAPFQVAGGPLTCSISVGIAIAPHDGQSSAELLKNADAALYRAKDEGRGVCRLYDQRQFDETQERRAIEQELHQALANNEFVLNYQPIVNLATGTPGGCEVLLRWKHPTRGLVSPVEFIPIAEATGLIRPIGEWILKEACRQAAKWPSYVRVSINLSAVQLRQPSMVTQVQEALEEAGIPPSRVEIEVTESIFLPENDLALGVIKSLRKLGCRIALDDFGTGYSSLSYLRTLRTDRIKIDRSFMKDVLTDLDAAKIVEAIAGLGKTLGISVTVEGIESAAQQAFVKRVGCHEAQGYFLCKPVSVDQIQERLLANYASDSEKPKNVLFVSPTNSVRSIMAECMLRRIGFGRFRAFSAGIEPAAGVAPAVIETLQEQGFPTHALRPKSVLNFAGNAAIRMDMVVLLRADGEPMPEMTFPGTPQRMEWRLPTVQSLAGGREPGAADYGQMFLLLNDEINKLVGDKRPIENKDISLEVASAFRLSA